MPSLNELKYASMASEVSPTIGTSLNELEHLWLTLKGVSAGGKLNERWYELFGQSDVKWNEAAHAWLTAQGIPEGGTLNERWYQYWSGGGVITPAFWALTPDPNTYEMLGVREGVGGLTVTHAEPIYAADHEGIYREAAANEPVWEGGRVVRNLFLYSEDMESGSSTVSNATVNSSTLLTFTAQNGYFSRIISTNDSHSYTFTFKARNIDGNTSLQMFTSGSASGQAHNITIDSALKRYSVTVDGRSGGGNIYFGIRDANASGHGQVEVTEFQVEDVTGKTNQNPGEYVPTTTAPVTRVYANSNGNTVLNNVVTEAVGPALAEAPYLKYQPAATNYKRYSNNATEVTRWGNTGNLTTSFDQVGLTGAPNTASRITRPSGTDQKYLQYSPGSTTKIGTTKAYLRAVGGSSFAHILHTGNNNYIQCDLVNGTITNTGGTSLVDYEVIDCGNGVYAFLMESNQDVANYRLYPFGGQPTDTAGPSDDLPGSIDLLNMEFYEGKSIAEVRGLGPIFTTSAAGSTDVTEYLYDLSNAEDNTAWYFESLPHADYPDDNSSVYTPGYVSMSTSTSGALIHYRNQASGRVRRHNTCAVVYKPSADTPYKVGYVYHGDGPSDRMTVNGVHSEQLNAPVPPGKSLGAIAVMRSTSGIGAGGIAAGIRNLRRYDIDSYQQGVDIIDGLMA